MKTHESHYRVYYEDTDAGGVVYYANYLKYAERGRTEMLRDVAIEQAALAESHGVYFVVKSANMQLHKPARLDDLLTVKTDVKNVKGASLAIQQHIMRQADILATVDVVIVCVNKQFTPARLPHHIKEVLS